MLPQGSSSGCSCHDRVWNEVWGCGSVYSTVSVSNTSLY